MRRLLAIPAGGWARLHLAIGLLVCVALPGASYVDGSRRLAYTMFAEAGAYRVEVRATDAAGETFDVPATFLAAHTSGPTAVYLAGAERWKAGPTHRTPRSLASPLAALGCVAARDLGRPAPPLRVHVTIVERDDRVENDGRAPDGADRVVTAEGDAACPR